MVAASWLITFSIMIPTWRGLWGRFGLDTSIGSCSILHDKYDRSPKEFLFIAAFMLPCICIVICYARIFMLVRKAAIRAASKNTELPTTPTSLQATAQAAKVADKSRDKQQAKGRENHKDKAKDKNKNKKGKEPGKQKEKQKEENKVIETENLSDKETIQPFFVTESLAYIDDNVSSESFPISYSIRPEAHIDANVVLQDHSRANSKDTLVGSVSGTVKAKTTRPGPYDIDISKSQTSVEQAKNS